MIRILLVLIVLAATAGAVVAYGDPGRLARAGSRVSYLLHKRSQPLEREVQIVRGPNGEFALQAKINGVNAPMVIDTGATQVVLTYETAKAVGKPVADVVPAALLNRVTHILTEVIGPMAPLVLRDQIEALGASLDNLPESKLDELVVLIGTEISDSKLKHKFEESMFQEISNFKRF